MTKSQLSANDSLVKEVKAIKVVVIDNKESSFGFVDKAWESLVKEIEKYAKDNVPFRYKFNLRFDNVAQEEQICLHKTCVGCKNGTCSGVHMLSCPCKNCSPRM